mmetsp:Transcript_24785/g.80166  ORF Transcript_24785/g.80166 Transcript_24785/m.80166 type:complete len:306 (-) Transcript_24785:186-1103(-)
MASARSSLRSVPSSILKPTYARTGLVVPPNFHDVCEPHEREIVERLRVAARFAREMLDYTCSLAVPGVSGNDIDALVHEKIIQGGAYPAPLNYMTFPKSICSSPNAACCHGIPDDLPFEKGDLVSFDISVFLDGVFGDNCATVLVGDHEDDVTSEATTTEEKKDPRKKKDDDPRRALLEATRLALDRAVEAVGPGTCLTRVGDAIADVAEPRGYGIVEQYCGHGIGTTFHTAPLVQHHRNRDAFLLRPGHVFTIEPILTATNPAAIYVDGRDGWTVRTRDHSLSAQFEHMVLITHHGAEVLTVND